jgi:hypothetical protein
MSKALEIKQQAEKTKSPDFIELSPILWGKEVDSGQTRVSLCFLGSFGE